jgi:hypothetical protein
MNPVDAACLVATKLQALGLEADLVSATPRSIQFAVPSLRLPLNRTKSSLSHGLWVQSHPITLMV